MRGLVLRKTKLGETDTILTILSDQGDQVRAVAKGLRRPGSRFGGRLEPFSVVDLLLATGKSLDVVTEARTVTSHGSLLASFERSAAGSVIVDACDRLSCEGQEEERLFALATVTLDSIEGATETAVPSLVVAFLMKALAMHGYRPQLATCVTCGADLGDHCCFAVAEGGALCATCGGDDPAALRVPRATLRWLEVLLGSTMAQIADAPLPPEALRACVDIVRMHLAFHAPGRWRALDYYVGLLV